MKAIRVQRTGGPEVLRLEEVPTPEPGPGQLLIRVEAAGVNFVDVYHRTGLYKVQLPFTPGREGAGMVERVGEGVTTFRRARCSSRGPHWRTTWPAGATCCGGRRR